MDDGFCYCSWRVGELAWSHDKGVPGQPTKMPQRHPRWRPAPTIDRKADCVPTESTAWPIAPRSPLYRSLGHLSGKARDRRQEGPDGQCVPIGCPCLLAAGSVSTSAESRRQAGRGSSTGDPPGRLWCVWPRGLVSCQQRTAARASGCLAPKSGH